ncbi:hypothetical protein F5Y12DRAFT_733799, partial [Xylaria sp. FL1777]
MRHWGNKVRLFWLVNAVLIGLVYLRFTCILIICCIALRVLVPLLPSISHPLIDTSQYIRCKPPFLPHLSPPCL